jgi:hypothetical protein
LHFLVSTHCIVVLFCDVKWSLPSSLSRVIYRSSNSLAHSSGVSTRACDGDRIDETAFVIGVLCFIVTGMICRRGEATSLSLSESESLPSSELPDESLEDKIVDSLPEESHCH